MKLERWWVVSRIQGGIVPPEEPGNRLCGVVTGHHRIADGHEVTTSPVLLRRGDRVVTKSGSEYELGQPERVYESVFPGARERLLIKQAA